MTKEIIQTHNSREEIRYQYRYSFGDGYTLVLFQDSFKLYYGDLLIGASDFKKLDLAFKDGNL